jgi:aldehyde:ferredoxin oxidoreductase
MDGAFMDSKFGGYMGRVLDIDMTRKSVCDYPVTDMDREKFIGGKTLAAKILFDELTPNTDVFSPENIIVFMTGPFTGTGAPCTSRFDISTKNALTGGIASSNCGGTFGIHLKKAGYDGLVIRGRAARPSLLKITESGVDFVDASSLWGKDTEETQKILEKQFGHKRGMAVIGPAGENLVRYASVISGERAAGRCGVGAVMGSKNIKAIVSWGGKKPPVNNPTDFRKAVKKWVKLLKENPATSETLPMLGTANLVNACNASGTMPTRNFQKGTFERAHLVSGEEMAEKHLANNTGCVSCPIRCGRLVRLGDRIVKGPEYETIGMLGPNIENDDLGKIIEWNYKLDLLGMDTITAGATIACAMELNEKGLWNNGLEFGKTDGISSLLDDIAHRRGIGGELADGSLRLALKHGAPELSMNAKGMEFAAYSPRRAVGHGLGYATSNRGGCHINGGYLIYFEAVGPVTMDPLSPKAKPEFCVFQQNMMEALSASGNCIFTTYALIPGIASELVPPASATAEVVSKIMLAAGAMLRPQGRALKDWMLPFHLPVIPHTETLSALTGMNIDLGHFAVAGERGFTLERMFNMREGMDSGNDALPPRLTDEPQSPDDPRTKVPLDQMLPVYYETRDWDEQGAPTKRLLKKLALDFAEPALRLSEASCSRHKNPFPETVDELKKETADFNRLLKKHLDQNKKINDMGDGVVSTIRKDELKKKVSVLRTSRLYVQPERCRSCGLCLAACPAGAIDWRQGTPAVINAKKCVSCGKCFDACPANFGAIAIEKSDKVTSRKNKMRVEIDAALCRKCGKCSRNCPTGAIQWQKKETARVEQKLCVKCGVCQIVCPDSFNAVRINGKLKVVEINSGPPATKKHHSRSTPDLS